MVNHFKCGFFATFLLTANELAQLDLRFRAVLGCRETPKY